jgi:hypothetical protein
VSGSWPFHFCQNYPVYRFQFQDCAAIVNPVVSRVRLQHVITLECGVPIRIPGHDDSLVDLGKLVSRDVDDYTVSFQPGM